MQRHICNPQFSGEGGCTAGGKEGSREKLQWPDVSALSVDAQDQQRKQCRGCAIIILVSDLHYAAVYLAKDTLPCVSIFDCVRRAFHRNRTRDEFDKTRLPCADMLHDKNKFKIIFLVIFSEHHLTRQLEVLHDNDFLRTPIQHIMVQHFTNLN
jgi:hypothetical protein